MAQVQSSSATTSQKSVERKGLRHALRRWRECFSKDKPSSSQAPRTETPASPMFPTANTPAIPSQLGQASPPDLDGVALFKATTQTIIHSPLDKRNKASNTSSPTSTLRRNYLGSRRNTAPADYFSFGAKASSGQKDPWGAPSSGETTSPTGPGHSRGSSRLRFSLSRRSSMHQSSQSASNVVSPAPSAPSPAGYENEHYTRQAATTAAIAALVKAHEKISIDVVDVGKKDTPNGSPSFERKEVERLEGEKQEEGGTKKLSKDEKPVDAEKLTTDKETKSHEETSSVVQKQE